MRRAVLLAVALAVAGCGGSGLHPDASVRIPAALPPAPSSWPRSPRFPSTSCWARHANAGPIPAAPSVAIHMPARAPVVLARAIASRLPDVRRIVLTPVPHHARTHAKGYFAGVEPPANALWAYVSARTSMLGGWEGALAAGALRDDLCASGGPPLVGWWVGRFDGGFSDAVYPFEQRFPNPTRAAFRRRVALVARRYGFRVVSLRLLRPRELALALVVWTDRSRRSFVTDVPTILTALDPRNGAAATFEGFYFEALDRNGAFVRTENVYRGTVEGGQWSANRSDYPFAHG